ncbi:MULTISPECIES: hypothetical protein [unclassified Herbaspirillum]
MHFTSITAFLISGELIAAMVVARAPARLLLKLPIGRLALR